MALTKCPECGRANVSDSAEMCLDCGYGIKAHFQEIERKRLLEQQRLEREKQDEEAKRIREEKERAELDTIKMPSKPSIKSIHYQSFFKHASMSLLYMQRKQE